MLYLVELRFISHDHQPAPDSFLIISSSGLQVSHCTCGETIYRRLCPAFLSIGVEVALTAWLDQESTLSYLLNTLGNPINHR